MIRVKIKQCTGGIACTWYRPHVKKVFQVKKPTMSDFTPEEQSAGMSGKAFWMVSMYTSPFHGKFIRKVDCEIVSH